MSFCLARKRGNSYAVHESFKVMIFVGMKFYNHVLTRKRLMMCCHINPNVTMSIKSSQKTKTSNCVFETDISSSILTHKSLIKISVKRKFPKGNIHGHVLIIIIEETSIALAHSAMRKHLHRVGAFLFFSRWGGILRISEQA